MESHNLTSEGNPDVVPFLPCGDHRPSKGNPQTLQPRLRVTRVIKQNNTLY